MEKPLALLEVGPEGLAAEAEAEDDPAWACRLSEAAVSATRPRRRRQELEDQRRTGVFISIHLKVAARATVYQGRSALRDAESYRTRSGWNIDAGNFRKDAKEF